MTITAKWLRTLHSKHLSGSLTVMSLVSLGYACDVQTLDSSTSDHASAVEALSGAAGARPEPARGKHDRGLHGGCPASCGDGALQAGEQCDDGNTTSRDGCSASCGFDDDTSTPGDDRPGFMVCGSSNCATGDECCLDGSGNVRVCQLPGTTCNGVWGECDGPEDCSNGDLCWEARWPLCTPPDSLDPRGTRRCHTDADCQEDTTCMSGSCR